MTGLWRRVSAGWKEMAGAWRHRRENPEWLPWGRRAWGPWPAGLVVILAFIAVFLALAGEHWGVALPRAVRLFIGSPAVWFTLVAGLRLRRLVPAPKDRAEAADTLARRFEAVALPLAPGIAVVALAEVVMAGSREAPSLFERIQSFALFNMTQELVSGPIELSVWVAMWVVLLLATLAFHADVVEGAWSLFAYTFSLALTLFVTKLLLVDLRFTEMLLTLLLQWLPWKELVQWLPGWLQLLTFRSAMVLVELGVIGSVWVTAKSHFAGSADLEEGFFDRLSTEEESEESSSASAPPARQGPQPGGSSS